MSAAGHRTRVVLALAFFVACVAWAGGFAWFLHRSSVPVRPPMQADGIVALTGGSGRVEAALRLLAEGRAQVALLSGIGGGAELAEFARRAGLEPGPLEPRVTLGRSATSTRGNATETAAWARDYAIRSLIVVTASYHMPRALAELASAMPDVTLYPAPVMPSARVGARTPGMLLLMTEEYTKWLATTFGLSRLAGSGQPHDLSRAQNPHADAPS